MSEPWSLTFLRKEWQEKIEAHRRLQSDTTEMRAITAERRYVLRVAQVEAEVHAQHAALRGARQGPGDWVEEG